MNDKRSGPKRRALAALLAGALALALCACSQFDGRYDDEDFLTSSFDSYATVLWAGHREDDGSYGMDADSFSGLRTLYEFTTEQAETLCEVDSTLACTEGEAKLLVVDTEAGAIAAQWPLDSAGPMTVTLPAGSYRLRIAGKSAKFDGQITLTLDGQTLPWNDILADVQDGLSGLLDGELKDALQDAKDSLTEAFGDPGAA